MPPIPPPAPPPSTPGQTLDPRTLSRPAPVLLTYYIIMAAFTVIGFPFVFLPLFFKYETLKYRFDDEGVSMSWGILFRREVLLTYRRIQDIHLTRNIIQRWLGLATVSIQTAAGSGDSEMSIEGVLEAEALRDFLYTKMRGARGQTDPAAAHHSPAAIAETGQGGGPAAPDEALDLLRQIRDALAAAAARQPGPEGRP